LGEHGPEFAVALPGTAEFESGFKEVKAAVAPPAKRRGLWWGLIFLCFMTLLVAGSAFSFYLYLRSVFAEDKINSLLTRAFGEAAAAGSATIRFPDSLVIHRVHIPDAEDASKAAVEVGNINVNWEPWEMWQRKRLKSIVLGHGKDRPAPRFLREMECQSSSRIAANRRPESLEQCRVRVLEGDLNFDFAGESAEHQAACAIA